MAENGHPARCVKLLKSDSEVHDAFITFDEYQQLKATAGQKRLAARSTLFNDRLEWLMLACNSGLRPGEQAMLEFSDVDLVHGFIHVQAKPDLGFHIKNYQDRYIPLAPEARVAIERLRDRRKPAKVNANAGNMVEVDLLFPRPDGSCWGDLADSMEALFVEAGLNRQGTKRRNRITLHSLRHTFACWLAMAGLPLRRIQELLGHKSILTTERYSHLGTNGVKPYYIELARVMSGSFVINSVITGAKEGAPETLQIIERIGGGGATRTPDLGIMRPSL